MRVGSTCRRWSRPRPAPPATCRRSTGWTTSTSSGSLIAAGAARRRLPRRDLVPARPAAPWRGRARRRAPLPDLPRARPPRRVPARRHRSRPCRPAPPRDASTAWTRQYSRLCVLPGGCGRRGCVIAVSEFTKRELVELLAAPPEKIRVVPNARRRRPSRRRARRRGRLRARRRHARAAQEPAAAGRGARAARRRAARRRRARLGRRRPLGAGVRWLGRVADEELARLYRGARCLVYPSLYEGFGIPVLEAMACGTPVVTSRGGATEEVAGGAAVLVDPLDAARSPAGSRRRLARRDELRAARASSARARSTGPRRRERDRGRCTGRRRA